MNGRHSFRRDAGRVFSGLSSQPVYLIRGQGMTKMTNRVTYDCFDMVDLSFHPVF